VRPHRIAILDPCSDHLASLIEAEEQRLIQELIAHLAIEALDIKVNGVTPKSRVRRLVRAIGTRYAVGKTKASSEGVTSNKKRASGKSSPLGTGPL